MAALLSSSLTPPPPPRLLFFPLSYPLPLLQWRKRSLIYSLVLMITYQSCSSRAEALTLSYLSKHKFLWRHCSNCSFPLLSTVVVKSPFLQRFHVPLTLDGILVPNFKSTGMLSSTDKASRDLTREGLAFSLMLLSKVRCLCNFYSYLCDLHIYPSSVWIHSYFMPILSPQITFTVNNYLVI